MTSKLWQEMNVEEKEEYNLKADALLLHKLITPAVSAALTDTAPEIEVPSISSSAMMVELSISQWLGRRKTARRPRK